MSVPVTERVRKRRAALRAAGLRPVQIWGPDGREAGVDTVPRGDLVTVAVAGDFGKPRPALVIQSDRFSSTATVTVLLVSSTLVEAPLVRLTVDPSAGNGLLKQSQVMVDKAMTVKRDKLGERLGRLDDDILTAVNRALALFLGFA